MSTPNPNQPYQQPPNQQPPNQQPPYQQPPNQQPPYQQPPYQQPPYQQPPYQQPPYQQPPYQQPPLQQRGYAALFPGGSQQPPPINWAPRPPRNPNVPPGLEYLSSVGQLSVVQKIELLEELVHFETENKYVIKNGLGQQVYYAAEESSCCNRMCCGKSRPFDIAVFDNSRMEVIRFSRGLKCDSCWFPCCLQEMDVFAPPGRLAGKVEQEWSLCKPKYRLKNADDEVVLRIVGPGGTTSCCGKSVRFEVLSLEGMRVGTIEKQWSGFVKEAFTDADHFGITFPLDLHVETKATLLGALFLIDYMFFEEGE